MTNNCKDWKHWWDEDEPIIRKALINMEFSVDTPLPIPQEPETGVRGKSRVWLIFLRTKFGDELSLIAKLDEPERFKNEWKAIGEIRALSAPIQAMLPVPKNKPEHNVIIYENVAGKVLTGKCWSLKKFLKQQLPNNLNNCLKALEYTLEPLRLFYVGEPGRAYFTDSQGRGTWGDAFSKVQNNLEEIKQQTNPKWLSGFQRQLPDPFKDISDCLKEQRGRLLHSRIHGDLNLTNIFVGLTGRYRPEKIFLIDLTNSQRDTVTAMDLSRLECEFWHEIFVALELEGKNWTDTERLNTFVTIRDYLDGRTREGQFSEIEWNALSWVNKIRQGAFDMLSPSQSEYCMEDYMTALYLTHLQCLTFESVQETELKRSIAMLGASLALEYLLLLQRGENPPLPKIADVAEIKPQDAEGIKPQKESLKSVNILSELLRSIEKDFRDIDIWEEAADWLKKNREELLRSTTMHIQAGHIKTQLPRNVLKTKKEVEEFKQSLSEHLRWIYITLSYQTKYSPEEELMDVAPPLTLYWIYKEAFEHIKHQVETSREKLLPSKRATEILLLFIDILIKKYLKNY